MVSPQLGGKRNKCRGELTAMEAIHDGYTWSVLDYLGEGYRKVTLIDRKLEMVVWCSGSVT